MFPGRQNRAQRILEAFKKVAKTGSRRHPRHPGHEPRHETLTSVKCNKKPAINCTPVEIPEAHPVVCKSFFPYRPTASRARVGYSRRLQNGPRVIVSLPIPLEACFPESLVVQGPHVPWSQEGLFILFVISAQGAGVTSNHTEACFLESAGCSRLRAGPPSFQTPSEFFILLPGGFTEVRLC